MPYLTMGRSHEMVAAQAGALFIAAGASICTGKGSFASITQNKIDICRIIGQHANITPFQGRSADNTESGLMMMIAFTQKAIVQTANDQDHAIFLPHSLFDNRINIESGHLARENSATSAGCIFPSCVALGDCSRLQNKSWLDNDDFRKCTHVESRSVTYVLDDKANGDHKISRLSSSYAANRFEASDIKPWSLIGYRSISTYFIAFYCRV